MAKKEKLSLDELLEQALVKDEDKPYVVPSNWVWTKLWSLVDIKTGRKDANYGEENGKYYFFTCASEPIRCNGYSFEGESILLAGNGANVGLSLFYDGKFEAYQRTYVLQTLQSINLKYIFYHLICFWKEYNNDKQYGTATNYIKLGNIQNYLLSLPPFSEQQRIVDLIESLFEKLDRAIVLVQNALDSFENRKSAILHKAFTGELTSKWREENGVMDVEIVLRNLCKYRLDSVKTPSERSKIGNLFNTKERNSNEQLPKGWQYVTLEKLCESFQYGTSTKSENKGEVVVIRMGNLQSGKIDWTNLKYTSDKNDIEKFLLRKGNVLFNRTNSPELVGKTSIYLGEKPAIFAGYLIRINNFEQVDSSYLNYMMNTSFAKEYCMSVKSDGVNQSNINAQKLAKFEIPLCSINEQKEIVRILDILLGNEQKAKEVNDVIESIDIMKKSILARAFHGELSTNNSDEESALELLKEVLRDKHI